MIPTLKTMRDGTIRHRRELIPLVAAQEQLTDEQTLVTLPTGELKYSNRVGWGLSFLTNVGALARPKRGYYQITDSGKQLVELYPNGASDRELQALGADPNSPIRESLRRLEARPRRSMSRGSTNLE